MLIGLCRRSGGLRVLRGDVIAQVEVDPGLNRNRAVRGALDPFGELEAGGDNSPHQFRDSALPHADASGEISLPFS